MASSCATSLFSQLKLRGSVALPISINRAKSVYCPTSTRTFKHISTTRRSPCPSNFRTRASTRDGQPDSLSNSDLAFRAIEEIRAVFDKVAAAATPPVGEAASVTPDDTGLRSDPFQTLVEEICSARDGRIVLYGVGREGLMMRALAMRLYHLGLHASVVGDMSCPPIGRGDLLIVSAGPGRFSTVDALMGEARSAGARTAVITAQPSGDCARLADRVVYIPAQTMADDTESGVGGARDEQGNVLPMGSIYEGALFFLGEVVVRLLREELGETRDTMRARHTNLE